MITATAEGTQRKWCDHCNYRGDTGKVVQSLQIQRGAQGKWAITAATERGHRESGRPLQLQRGHRESGAITATAEGTQRK